MKWIVLVSAFLFILHNSGSVAGGHAGSSTGTMPSDSSKPNEKYLAPECSCRSIDGNLVAKISEVEATGEIFGLVAKGKGILRIRNSGEEIRLSCDFFTGITRSMDCSDEKKNRVLYVVVGNNLEVATFTIDSRTFKGTCVGI